MSSTIRRQSIRDIVELLTSHLPDAEDVLSQVLGTDTAMRRTTHEVLRHLDRFASGGGDDRMLSRAYDKLLGAMQAITVGPPNDSRPWTDAYRSIRDLLAARVLFAYGYSHTGHHVIKRLYQRARTAEITPVEIQCLYFLRLRASLAGNITRVEALTAEINAMQHIYTLELEAEGWEDIAIALVSSRQALHASTRRRIDALGHKAEALRKNYDRWIFHVTAFRLRSRALQLHDDWEGARAVCDEALRYYAKHPVFSSPGRIGEFAVRSMVCSTAMNDLRGARKRANAMRPLVVRSPSSWLAILEYLYNLAMRSVDLPYAASICAEARLHYKKAYTQRRKDLWRLREVSVHIIASLRPQTHERVCSIIGPPQFYLANIRRKMPGVVADTTNNNVILTYCTIISLLQAKRYSDIVLLRDSMHATIKRHLTPSSLPRTAVLYRMFMRMISNDFVADATERACESLYNKLVNVLPVGLEAPELVPYHVIWPQIIDLLRRNADDERRRR